jgi:hypothetical protein
MSARTLDDVIRKAWIRDRPFNLHDFLFRSNGNSVISVLYLYGMINIFSSVDSYILILVED